MEWPLTTILALAILTAILVPAARRPISAVIRTLRWLSGRIVDWTATWTKNRESRRRTKLEQLHRMRTFTQPDHRPSPDPWLWR